MADSFNDLVDGLFSGYDQGQKIRDQRTERNAQTAEGNSLLAQIAALAQARQPRQQQPQQPMPNLSPGAGMDAAAPISLKPSTAAGLSPQALQGLAVLNGQQPPVGQGDPSAAGPGGPPAAAGPGGPANIAPGGVASGPQPLDPKLSAPAQPDYHFDDPTQEAQQNIAAMAQSIKAANPNIDGRTLLLAVQQNIENIKGLAPLTKATMNAQVKTLEMGQRWTIAQQKLAILEQNTAIALKRAKNAEERNRIIKDHDQQLEQIQRESIGERYYASDNALTGREYSSDNSSASRDRATDSGGENSVDRVFSTAYNAAIQGGKSEEQAAQAGNAAVQSRLKNRGSATPAAPRPGPAPARRSLKPVKVRGPDDIANLARGTPWVSTDGSRRGVATGH